MERTRDQQKETRWAQQMDLRWVVPLGSLSAALMETQKERHPVRASVIQLAEQKETQKAILWAARSA